MRLGLNASMPFTIYIASSTCNSLLFYKNRDITYMEVLRPRQIRRSLIYIEYKMYWTQHGYNKTNSVTYTLQHIQGYSRVIM